MTSGWKEEGAKKEDAKLNVLDFLRQQKDIDKQGKLWYNVNKEIQRRLIVMDFKILLNQTIGTRVLIPSLRKYNLQIDRLGVPH